MKKVLILLLVVISSGVIKAQEVDLSKYKSLFTLNFIRYIGWPEEAKTGDFVIGVLKGGKMAEHLNKDVAGKKVGYQTIVVKEFSSIDKVTDCNIVFVSNKINYTKHSKAISEKLNNKNTLIITEVEGAILSGSMINFVVVGSKLRFEVSSYNANEFGLKFSSSLMSLTNAIDVKNVAQR